MRSARSVGWTTAGGEAVTPVNATGSHAGVGMPASQSREMGRGKISPAGSRWVLANFPWCLDAELKAIARRVNGGTISCGNHVGPYAHPPSPSLRRTGAQGDKTRLLRWQLTLGVESAGSSPTR